MHLGAHPRAKKVASSWRAIPRSHPGGSRAALVEGPHGHVPARAQQPGLQDPAHRYGAHGVPQPQHALGWCWWWRSAHAALSLREVVDRDAEVQHRKPRRLRRDLLGRPLRPGLQPTRL